VIGLFIPSPPISGVQLGPFFIHFYALTMLSGMAAAFLIGRRRWVARGGTAEVFENIVIIAIPSGIVGARIYHVLTHWGDYFGPGHLNPFAIWEGGIAMFGSLIGGAIGAYLAARHYRAKMWAFADCVAPGIAVAQAVGRLGNWFNQELFGQPSTAPWALEIDAAHRPPGMEQFATFQPTFLYELLLNLLAALVIIRVDKALKLGRGACFALYIGIYGAIRFVIEGMRTDFSYYLGPLRTNQVTALAVCVGGAAAFVLLRRFLPGREDAVQLPRPAKGDAAASAGDGSAASAGEEAAASD